MSKVIVTGANGFLGSWLTRELIKSGHDVYALVRKSSDMTELSGIDCQYLYGDVTNKDSLIEHFAHADSVFHAAGVVGYKKHLREQMELVNVGGTQNVVEACLKNKVRRLVHISSVVAIGAGFSEEEVLNENSEYNLYDLNLGYFETKRKAEFFVKKAVSENGLDAVILNPSTIYGAGDARKGSRSTQVKVAKGTFPFYTSGGVNVVAVEDVVSGILAAWKVGRVGERYILSSENLKIYELFKMIAQEAEVTPPKYLIPGALLHTIGFVGNTLAHLGYEKLISSENAWTATLYHWFNNSKAQQELGFKPKPARVAIANSVHWMKNNGILRT